MTLETLSNVLEVECGWIQMAATGKTDLELVAYHGFNFREQIANIVRDVDDIYRKDIIGLGNSLVIPNLPRNDKYNFSVLTGMGYQWLVAVPIRNHRLAGVMSVTSRRKRKINNDFGGLISVIAGLIITAYEKSSHIPGKVSPRDRPETGKKDKSLVDVDIDELFNLNSDSDTKDESLIERKSDKEDFRPAAPDHNRNMYLFRMTHRSLSETPDANYQDN